MLVTDVGRMSYIDSNTNVLNLSPSFVTNITVDLYGTINDRQDDWQTTVNDYSSGSLMCEIDDSKLPEMIITKSYT